jgi:hypothetical protein
MADSFHIQLNHLKSVEIVLAALRSYPDPDAAIIAGGIEKTLVHAEDGIVKSVGGIEIGTEPKKPGLSFGS